MTMENALKSWEKFNFSGEILNSDFEIIEADTHQPGYREVTVMLGNEETGQQSIKARYVSLPLDTKLTGVDIVISHDIGGAVPMEMHSEGYTPCKISITNTGESDYGFTVYVKEDLEKLKKVLAVQA